jgi:hypothetical protein
LELSHDGHGSNSRRIQGRLSDKKDYIHSEPSIFPGAGGTSYRVTRGEAVVVDLGNRGLLFALLRGIDDDVDYSHHVALNVFPAREQTHIGAKVTLTPDQYPMFVRFKDLNNPRTVEEAIETEPTGSSYPQHTRIKGDHFELMFGKGVRLVQVTIETTNDPTKEEVRSVLPWLADISGKTLSGQTGVFTNKLYDRLDTSDFYRGTKK